MPDTLTTGLLPTYDTAATRHRNHAMTMALAMVAAAGRAERLAEIATKPWVPELINLRYRLNLYAAVTRDPMLRAHLPEYRRRARDAVRAYRALRDGGA
jgi:hypothetical protein